MFTSYPLWVKIFTFGVLLLALRFFGWEGLVGVVALACAVQVYFRIRYGYWLD